MSDIIVTEQNIQDFKPQLGETAIMEQVRMIVDDLTQSLATGPAFYFLRVLEATLKEVSLLPLARLVYDELVLKLKFVAFPLLENEEQKALLHQYFTFALKNDIDVKNRIHLVFYPYFRGREDNEKVTVLLRALETNQEEIGTEPLQISDSKQGRPTVSNWLQDYRGSLAGKRASSLSAATYLTQNQNANKLQKENLELLKNVIFIYDWMRFSAVPAELLTQDISGTSAIKTPAGASYIRKEKLFVPPAAPQAPRVSIKPPSATPHIPSPTGQARGEEVREGGAGGMGLNLQDILTNTGKKEGAPSAQGGPKENLGGRVVSGTEGGNEDLEELGIKEEKPVATPPAKEHVLPPPPVPEHRIENIEYRKKETHPPLTPPTPVVERSAFTTGQASGGEIRGEELKEGGADIQHSRFNIPDSSEDLYKKTIDELKKMREREKSIKYESTPSQSPPLHGGEKPSLVTPPPSLNEALINAGKPVVKPQQTEEQKDPEGHAPRPYGAGEKS